LGGTGEVLALDTETRTTRLLVSGVKGPVNVDVRGGVVHVTESSTVDPAAFDPARPNPAAMSVVRIPVEQQP
jgi:hypothetical protein